jgi:hypothetical protein
MLGAIDLYVVHFQVENDSSYPTGVCEDCINDLQICLNFRHKARQSYESINTYYSSSATKNELHGVETAAKLRKQNKNQSFDGNVKPPMSTKKTIFYKCEKCKQKFSSVSIFHCD